MIDFCTSDFCPFFYLTFHKLFKWQPFIKKYRLLNKFLMNSKSNNNISAEEEEDEVLIETDRFFHLFTLDNIEKARKKKFF